MKNITNYIIDNDLKISELKMLRYLSEKGKCKKTNIEIGSEINFYQVKLSLPKLINLGLVIEKDNQYSLNIKNPFIIKIFEVEDKTKIAIVSSKDLFDETKNPHLKLGVEEVLNNKKIKKRIIK